MAPLSDALADHRTPFIRQEWYVAALSEEVAEVPLSREALELVESRWMAEAEDFREISVRGDRAGLRMRQVIAKRAAEERQV